MLIDTHCHLTSPELASQFDAVIARAREAGVARVVTIATKPQDAGAALKLMERAAGVYLCAGVHPHQAQECGDDELERLAALHEGGAALDEGRAAARLVAVGETGLDFHYDFAPRERQEHVFRYQLALAERVNRPVVIHARQAEERVCDILSEYPALRGRVVFHCFSGDVGLAQRILDAGCWLSFTGIVTFKTADAVRAAARFAPLDRIMVETDSPYLAPAPHRGKRPCEPAFVALTARFLAELRGMPYDEFAAATSANAERFFSLPKGSA
jgi:TatD DNase family protein